jgi:lycopene cyclase CruP
MIRHLQRLTHGIHAALETDRLDRRSLSLLQPYQPNLSVTWLFQQAMSVRVGQSIPPEQINTLLSGVFQEMHQLGDGVLKPFLQDVVQFPALLQTLARVSIAQPMLGLNVIPQVGLPALLEWMLHFVNLGLYAGLHSIGQTMVKPLSHRLSLAQQYNVERWLDAWQYGSGNDYRGDGQ